MFVWILFGAIQIFKYYKAGLSLILSDVNKVLIKMGYYIIYSMLKLRLAMQLIVFSDKIWDSIHAIRNVFIIILSVETD